MVTLMSLMVMEDWRSTERHGATLSSTKGGNDSINRRLPTGVKNVKSISSRSMTKFAAKLFITRSVFEPAVCKNVPPQISMNIAM
eukprot:CAMPEP_0117524442 /NCGR_PEP_ID=MMETSP0784-20121206/35248_1 /TAXON_ID=39447 /ORGANISM="" /LENGTH=84 /DNA_ID=CAMNT_0005320591 /DNA_START=210 /DNA_END=464 /DNA_ORIENTATION=+